jgi:SNF2 family DNA or RNA helicase
LLDNTAVWADFLEKEVELLRANSWRIDISDNFALEFIDGDWAPCKEQAQLYESIRVAMDKWVRDAIKQQDLSRSHITILNALLKLRQVCCDPCLVKLERAKKVVCSAKL